MSRRKLTGAVDNMASAEEIAGVSVLEGTFSINVKDDDDKVVYTNDKEPFNYKQVDSLATALKLEGAVLNDSQVEFLGEALKSDNAEISEGIGKAVKAIVDLVNSDLKTSAKNNRYQAVFNQHKPLTEERLESAHAGIVRNFIKANPTVSVSTAIETLQQYGIVPKEFTVADYEDAPAPGRKK